MNFIGKTCTFAALTLAGGFALADAPAPVAKLAQIEGKVMVNTGTNYAIAAPGAQLQPGAKVATTKGSSVAVVYKDGCIKQLKENSILTVGPATECTANKINERVYLAEAVGDTATDAPSAAAGSLGATGPGRSSLPAIALWAGATGIAVALGHDGGRGSNASAE